jgi:hypothetical protein
MSYLSFFGLTGFESSNDDNVIELSPSYFKMLVSWYNSYSRELRLLVQLVFALISVLLFYLNILSLSALIISNGLYFISDILLYNDYQTDLQYESALFELQEDCNANIAAQQEKVDGALQKLAQLFKNFADLEEKFQNFNDDMNTCLNIAVKNQQYLLLINEDLEKINQAIHGELQVLDNIIKEISKNSQHYQTAQGELLGKINGKLTFFEDNNIALAAKVASMTPEIQKLQENNTAFAELLDKIKQKTPYGSPVKKPK